MYIHKACFFANRVDIIKCRLRTVFTIYHNKAEQTNLGLEMSNYNPSPIIIANVLQRNLLAVGRKL